MGIRETLGTLVADQKRREVLLAVTSAYMLVQLSSLPVALSLPTLADYFQTGLDETAWVVVVYLASLGSFVLLGARLGDKYGHARVFFVGILAASIGAILIAVSTSLLQVIMWRAVTGVGAALVMGNANAILASVYPPDERGRAFAIPIIGSRFGTLTGLVLFAVFLQFFSWRFVFASFLPMGIIAIVFSIPMLRHGTGMIKRNTARLDVIGAVLLVGTLGVLIMSGNHLHGGEESFLSGDGLRYHVPMHLLFLLLLGVFILVERMVKNPVMELGHFKQKYFSMSLVSNVTYHFSMLATMTLIPILVERGFGREPLWVTFVLLPNQILGMVLPLIAGSIYDKYNPKFLRPGAMMLIAGGFLLLGLTATSAPFWAIPLLMLPISIGTSVFNPINNAAVMNSLPTEHRGFASGMLETTREMGHALGATASAAALAIVIPVGVSILPAIQSQGLYREGFQFAAMMVVLVLLTGAVIAQFHKSTHQVPKSPPPQPATDTPLASGASAGDD